MCGLEALEPSARTSGVGAHDTPPPAQIQSFSSIHAHSLCPHSCPQDNLEAFILGSQIFSQAFEKDVAMRI